MRRALAPICLLALLPLAGCLQVHTLLHLDADGSGTIEETIALNSSLLQMLRASALEEGADPDAALLAEARFRARAAELGEGVTFVRAEPLDILFGGGYRAVYAFEDVERLRLGGDLDAALPAALSEAAEAEMGMGGDEAMDDEDDEPITFAYAPGALTIRLPRPEQEAEEAVPPTDEAPADSLQEGMEQMMAGMMGMFQDMAFSLAVDLPAPVTDTDAAYAEGRTVILFDVDMEALMQNPATMARLENMGGLDNLDALAALGEVPGLRIEPRPEVVVRFEE